MTVNRCDIEKVLELVKNPNVWDELWQQQLRSGSRKQQTEAETIKKTVQRWEKRAKPFAENVLGKKGSPRVEKIMTWLSMQGVNIDGCRVLDIGSGPGAFTIPFAKQAKEVVALEPVKGMVDSLRTEMNTAGIENIIIVEEPWETVSIEEQGWTGAFDLVFASMVPGVNDLRTLEKAIECSKAYFFTSSFAGKRDYEGIRELWPVLFNKEYPPFHLDIQYKLNLIYTKGYNFTFRVWEENRDKQLPVDEAVEELYHQLQIMVDDQYTIYMEENNQEIVAKIKSYVEMKAIAGQYNHRVSTRFGAILIDLRK